MPDDRLAFIHAGLVDLYGAEDGQQAFDRLLVLLDSYRARLAPPHAAGLAPSDAVLITYGDQVTEPGLAPLRSLAGFCRRHLAGVVSAVHILPFYPASSDDGFSVIDYRAVDPALGDWGDVELLGRDFRLMLDAVVNHVSAQSAWFQGFLQGDGRYGDYFITVPPGTDLSGVVRPRALPLLTTFETARGAADVWTTFSADQIDLNYASPNVLLEVIDVLLCYVQHGASLIRLDAIAYLWKQPGTTCINLQQVHLIVRLLRAALDVVAPHVMLVTETNVPHQDNISYFGDGGDEAQMVYNFALPPLVLHSFQTGSATALAGWATNLRLPSRRATFFNFLASHDGIGLNPVRGILSGTEIAALEERTQQRGGLVSYKNNPDGSRSAYELNVNYWDALCDPQTPELLATQVDRFMTAQAIMLVLPGTPGIYFHSLVGSRGWPQGVALTGRNRTINRQKLDRAGLEAALADEGTQHGQVFARYRRLLHARAHHPAFDPYGDMQVLATDPAVLGLLRLSRDGGPAVLCLHNVSARPQTVALPALAGDAYGGPMLDLITDNRLQIESTLDLQPYQTLWLARARDVA